MGKMSYGVGNSMGGFNPVNNRNPNSLTAKDPYFSSVVLGLHMDGTNGSTVFTDSSSYNRTVSWFGAASISTTESKFGGASGRFSSNGSILQVANSADLNPGANDFTIDFWHKPDSVTSGATQVIVDRGTFSNFTPYVVTQFNSSLRFACSSTGSSWLVDLFSASVLTAGQWHYVRAKRRGTAFELECNGVLIASQTASGSLMTSATPLTIGRGGGGTGQLFAYLDDLRITMGVARDSTVPTKAFPNS